MSIATFIHDPTIRHVEYSLGAAFTGLVGLCTIVGQIQRDRKQNKSTSLIIQQGTHPAGEVRDKADDTTSSASHLSRRLWTPGRLGLVLVSSIVFSFGSWFGIRTSYILHCWQAGHEDIVSHNYTGAEDLYRKAVNTDPSAAKSHLLLAGALLRQSKLAQAIPELYAAASLNLTDARVRILLGDVLVSTGASAQAEQAYREAIVISPKRADAHLKLGGCLLNLHRTDDAASEFYSATTLDTKNVKANTNLGFLLLAHKQQKDGIAYLKRAVDAAPKDMTVRNNLAMEFVRERMHAQAVAEFRAEIAIDPNYAAAYFNLGNALKDEHDKRGAKEAYQNYLRACANNPNSQVAVMRALAEIKALNSK